MMAPFTCLHRACTPILAALLVLTAPHASADKAQSDRKSGKACVVLLHGLARTHRSMNKIAAALGEANYRTFTPDYASRKFTIEELAMQVIPQVLQECRATSCDTIHFVTHSMGGILVRYYLSQQPIEGLGRVVMLSPPNQGSEVVDALRHNGLFRWYNGPAGLQLGTGRDDIAASLGVVDFPLGVIAGDVHAFFDTWWSNIIPGADDGKVSVRRTQTEGMSDFIVLPFSHAFIMRRELVIRQTLHFLEHGSFIHESRPNDPSKNQINR